MLSPKQIGTICFAIFSFIFSAPSFADPDIPSSASTADCKNNPLQTYSGTSNLQADWTANTIQLHWYEDSDATTEMNVASASQSCVYDGTLTPPATIPTKTGYTFKGWRVQVFDLTTLDTSINGDVTGYKDVPSYERSSNIEMFGLTEDFTWAVRFSYGDVHGKASCNTTSGVNGGNYDWNTNTATYIMNSENIRSSDTFENTGTGGRCWCRVTNIIPTGKLSRKATPTPWVFWGGNNWEVSSCSHYCPLYCAFAVQRSTEYRQVLFGQAN